MPKQKKNKRNLGLVFLTICAILTAYVYGKEMAKAEYSEQIANLENKLSNQKPIVLNESVIETIQRVCKDEGFDADLAVKIAACESYLNPYFVKVNKNKTIDRGIFAFNSKHYKQVSNECAFNVECATKAFIKEAKNGKINNWLCYKRVK